MQRTWGQGSRSAQPGALVVCSVYRALPPAFLGCGLIMGDPLSFVLIAGSSLFLGLLGVSSSPYNENLYVWMTCTIILLTYISCNKSLCKVRPDALPLIVWNIWLRGKLSCLRISYFQ